MMTAELRERADASRKAEEATSLGEGPMQARSSRAQRPPRTPILRSSAAPPSSPSPSPLLPPLLLYVSASLFMPPPSCGSYPRVAKPK